MYLKRFRKFVGPSYRKVRPIIMPKYRINKVSNSKIRKFQNKNLSGVRLIGIMPMYNENKKGNLERALNHISSICDEIVIYDDGSTDGSYEIASKYTKHIIRSSVNCFAEETKHHQEMIEMAVSLKADWILDMAFDEAYDRDGVNFGIRSLCRYGDKKGIDAFSFLIHNLWGGNKNYRVDKTWNVNWQCRLWKNSGKLKVDEKYGLHKGIVPGNLGPRFKTEIKLIHYGFISKKRNDERYKVYKENNLTGFDLEWLTDEKDLELKPFLKEWFPLI